MDLHHSAKRAEWLATDKAQRNVWQRLAARTHGIVTPANAVSVVGFAMVLWGLGELVVGSYTVAIALLFFGRMADVLDGYLANKTGTKSPLGETLDAGFDKIATMFAVLVLGMSGIAPWWVLVGLLAAQLFVIGVTIYSRHYHLHLHPSRSGKYSMAVSWLGLGGFIFGTALSGTTATVFTAFGYGLGGLGICLGAIAGGRYIQHISRDRQKSAHRSAH